MNHLSVTAALLIALLLAHRSADDARLDLSFMEGTWRMESGATVVEERWTDNTGGVMLGVSRTIKSGRTVFFEFLRIETRDDGVFYIAQPGGRQPTQFKLTSSTGGTLVFENPQHDFPQKITYQQREPDTLRASISGQRGGREATQSWQFERVK